MQRLRILLPDGPAKETPFNGASATNKSRSLQAIATYSRGRYKKMGIGIRMGSRSNNGQTPKPNDARQPFFFGLPYATVFQRGPRDSGLHRVAAEARCRNGRGKKKNERRRDRLSLTYYIVLLLGPAGGAKTVGTNQGVQMREPLCATATRARRQQWGHLANPLGGIPMGPSLN